MILTAGQSARISNSDPDDLNRPLFLSLFPNDSAPIPVESPTFHDVFCESPIVRNDKDFPIPKPPAIDRAALPSPEFTEADLWSPGKMPPGFFPAAHANRFVPTTGRYYDTALRYEPLGPPAAPDPTLFCCPIRAKTNIVYVCDCSGSMMTKFDILRQQLRKSIDSLRPTQQFNVIFLSSDQAQCFAPQLQIATPKSKGAAYDFLDRISPIGTSDPIPALRAAFANQPHVIYLLTDGGFPNNQQVIDELKKLNAAKKVKINTIAFFERGEEYQKLLKQIADNNSGAYRFISEKDIKP